MSKSLGAKTSIYLSTFESIFAADSKSKIKNVNAKKPLVKNFQQNL
jgi:hypothetical protein